MVAMPFRYHCNNYTPELWARRQWLNCVNGGHSLSFVFSLLVNQLFCDFLTENLSNSIEVKLCGANCGNGKEEIEYLKLPA